MRRKVLLQNLAPNALHKDEIEDLKMQQKINITNLLVYSKRLNKNYYFERDLSKEVERLQDSV